MSSPILHSISIEPSGEAGLNSGRPRYQVVCYTCGVMIHGSSTAPWTRVREHFAGINAYEQQLQPDTFGTPVGYSDCPASPPSAQTPTPGDPA